MRALAIAAVMAAAATASAAPSVTAPVAPSSQASPAPAPSDPAAVLRAADAAGATGDWATTATLVASLDVARLGRADLAEARRLRGLAAFFAGRLVDAEIELVAWLSLDLDARLDPSVTPPEAINFLESVRARHAAELRGLRPHVEHRWGALNLLPPWGQFQNGDRTKGWIVAGLGAALLAVDIGTYATLRSWCSPEDFTCDRGAGTVRAMRDVNYAAGGALLALYVYGVVDGFWNFRSGPSEVMMVPLGDGAEIMVVGRF